MSTVATAEKQAPAGPRELKVFMHSWLLYWWPVWVVGYLMAAWTLLDNQHMALLSEGGVVQGNSITAPEGSAPLLVGVHVSPSRVPGMVFAAAILTVVAFGTGWLSGWRAFTFVAALVAALMTVNWLGAWDSVARWASYLHVYVSLGGYLVISTGLLALWLVQLLVVDRRTYVIFTLSQIRVHYAIGEEERAYDTNGVSFEKAPYDWFRWLLGLGAGDLRLHVPGGQVIDIPNVVHLGRQLTAIETLLRTKDVQ